MSLAIINGHFINPADNTSAPLDLLVENGRVTKIGRNLKGNDTLDASGYVVCPGFVDIHCHFREPGAESKETIASGSQAAAHGGVTTVVTMANTSPAIDNAGLVELVIRRAREEACIRVLPAACATKGLGGTEITEMADLKNAGAVAVTDDGRDVSSSALMRRALEYANMVGIPFLSHCEDELLAEGGAMNEGYMAALMGIPGIPKAAEEIRIDRNIRLAELAGAHIHIQHVSTAAGVDIIRQAKKRGARVTAESAPHYFSLTDEATRGFNTNAKMNPPLREEEDITAIIEGFKDGTLDCIATDHAPHEDTSKDVEFDIATFGISGLDFQRFRQTGEPLFDTLKSLFRLLRRHQTDHFTLHPGLLEGIVKIDNSDTVIRFRVAAVDFKDPVAPLLRLRVLPHLIVQAGDAEHCVLAVLAREILALVHDLLERRDTLLAHLFAFRISRAGNELREIGCRQIHASSLELRIQFDCLFEVLCSRTVFLIGKRLHTLVDVIPRPEFLHETAAGHGERS